MYCKEVIAVVLLDESMKMLYEGGNGIVLSIVTRWMSSASEHLQNSAALAIGNMARSGICDALLISFDNTISFYGA